MFKKVESIHRAHAPHWVGDGLPVRNFFSYADLGQQKLSPFLMLDYGAPAQFPPSEKRLGVGMHPHRGFETVTFVYSGELAHRDTAGNTGVIGAGDVQWMTAGSGVLHEEMHSERFAREGGTLHMAQLWVNLPADLKMTDPRYQTIERAAIPVISLPENGGTVRVLAGELDNSKGPASTHTPMNIWDVELTNGSNYTFTVPSGFTTAIVVMNGAIAVGEHAISSGNLAVLSREGEQFTIQAKEQSHLLVLSGEPIPEPVVGYGPFVMNTRDQILEAIEDFQNGRFGVPA